MAVFDEADPERPNRLDWQILRNGAVTLYFDAKVLEEACIWFQEHHYRLYRFDGTQWKTPDDFYDAARGILGLPEYCGNNLDSLRDCLWSIGVPQEGGAILVFSRFDAFWQQWRTFSFDLLDILEEQSRKFLLFGQRLIILVQSDHSNLSFQPVGARPVLLNPTESFIKMKQNLKLREDRKHRR